MSLLRIHQILGTFFGFWPSGASVVRCSFCGKHHTAGAKPYVEAYVEGQAGCSLICCECLTKANIRSSGRSSDSAASTRQSAHRKVDANPYASPRASCSFCGTNEESGGIYIKRGVAICETCVANALQLTDAEIARASKAANKA